MAHDFDTEILAILEKFPQGITSLDVDEIFDGKGLERPRNTVRAKLNKFHKDGKVFVVGKSKPYLYFHSKYKDKFSAQVRQDAPSKNRAAELWMDTATAWRTIALSDSVTPAMLRQANDLYEMALEHD